MTEKSEILAQRVGSVKTQGGSGPTIELVTPGARMDRGPFICPPNCIPNCLPSCEPNIIRKPCDPVWRLPRPPWPPPKPN